MTLISRLVGLRLAPTHNTRLLILSSCSRKVNSSFPWRNKCSSPLSSSWFAATAFISRLKPEHRVPAFCCHQVTVQPCMVCVCVYVCVNVCVRPSPCRRWAPGDVHTWRTCRCLWRSPSRRDPRRRWRRSARLQRNKKGKISKNTWKMGTN